MFDAAVIGGGIIGGMILRELTKYNLSVCMLEKENDVCMGQSKANSGIVHAGYDADPGTLKAKFNVTGNKMMKSVTEDLGVKYKNIGSLVVAFSDEQSKTLEKLKERGKINGVDNMEIIGREKLKELEPDISEKAVSALWAKTAGIVCPYELTIAAIGNAMDNGAELIENFEVSSIEKNENFIIKSSDGKTIEAKIIINCAGGGSEKIAEMAGDFSFKINGRKGEYIILDTASGDFVSHTLFFCPTEKGKGILISPTVDKNIILGPTADDDVNLSDRATSAAGLSDVIGKAFNMCANVPVYNSITSFAGMRAYDDKHDFIVDYSKADNHLINVAGIESPGLTSSPAIAEYVVENLVSKLIKLIPNKNFNGKRKSDFFFKNLSVEEKNEIIKKDPSYGRIICRCEQVTEGEIIRAIRENPPARDIDAVKRRTRAGMGRCQGGFCQPYVAELISKETGIPFDEITKFGKNSKLLAGKTK